MGFLEKDYPSISWVSWKKIIRVITQDIEHVNICKAKPSSGDI